MMKNIMRLCIQEAVNGVNKGEGGPFGATAHAEIHAIRQASQKLQRFDLSDCILVTSSEPCPMCLSAIMWAGIKKVYYGCNVHDAKEIGFADEFIYHYLKNKSLTEPPIILEELLRDEALEAFKIWYQKEDKVPY